MRLSEAIRLGAMLGPQERGGWVDGEGRCALAGAAQASGVAPAWDDCYFRYGVNYIGLTERYPLLTERVVSPMRSAGTSVESAIIHLNDHGGWTREQIADWVETLEARSTETATAPVEESAEIQGVGNR